MLIKIEYGEIKTINETGDKYFFSKGSIVLEALYRI